ncbi:ECF transporter S component [Alicyclobacillus sp. SO9]|uniref:ECF transporter S component n=1 Tax=Alicyclobacillus sp. SO9 TaxID=2665646 RepID=UPI0018E8C42A|nr:ECF transporter S component [Alicyclobacillus sp. SO9]QQE80211.1 ECF transporter S component [Alicyclobacillus sp. SO9]
MENGSVQTSSKGWVDWKLRDIVVTAIIAVIGGAVYMGWDYLTNLFLGALGPTGQGIFNGVWWIAAALTGYILRRPGAAFLGGLLSAVVEFALGSPYGASAIISGLVQGGGAEVGFMLTGYRKWNVWSAILAGSIGGVGNILQWWFQYGGDKVAVGSVIGYSVTTILSGAIVAGLFPKWVGDSLNKAGVLRNFPIGRQSRL